MKHILLVEDDPFMTYVLNILLSRANYKVTAFPHGNDLSYEDYISANIILLNLNLPGKNGDELCAEIKSDERTKQIPVILISASPREPDPENCEDEFVEKPFNNNHLMQLIKQYAL